jgi:hypothetical protein
MEEIFSPKFQNLWAMIMAIALWFPVRNVIWQMTVRRAIRKAGEEIMSETEKQRLRRRAGVTSAMICIIFSFVYMGVLFTS